MRPAIGIARRQARPDNRSRPSFRDGCARSRAASCSSGRRESGSSFAPSSACVRMTTVSSGVCAAGLVQDRIGDADLADVVQGRGVAQPLAALWRPGRTRAASNSASRPTRLDVIGGLLRTRLGRAGQQADHLELRVEQLVGQVQVLESDRDIGAEQLDQAQVECVRSPRVADEQQAFAVLPVGEMQHVVIVAEVMAFAP